MAEQLFKLRGVPDDEAEDIRELLDRHQIDYYETEAGNWGVSMPAIWLRDTSQLDLAKSLLADYQKQRFVEVTAEYEELRLQGRQKTFLQSIVQHPIRFVIYLAISAAIIYISLVPFFSLSGNTLK